MGGAFTLIPFGSGTLIVGMALLTAGWAGGYARAVAARQGAGLDGPENSGGGPGRMERVGVLVTTLFLGLASWGLSLYALGLAVELTAVDSLGTGLSGAALAMLAAGAAGFMLVVGYEEFGK